MKTPILAKCNIHPEWFCKNKHDAPQCDNCVLVKHRKEPLYKWENGYKLKRCPKCGQYKLLTEYRLVSDRSGRKYRSWCKDCQKSYHHEHSSKEEQGLFYIQSVDNSYIDIQPMNIKELIQFIKTTVIKNKKLSKFIINYETKSI